jgi:predicted dithiol-disulfide oxidoreductase (DUF899 family)
LPFGRESLYLINKLNIEGNPAARLHDDRFPNETSAYCTARDTLLTAEMELRAKVEEDAALRRTLPLGGALKTDYVLTEGPADLSAEDAETQTRFPELFPPGKDTLIVYSFIYPEGGNPCPACTSLIDGLDGQAPHINARVNFAVFAKMPVAVFRAWGRERGWRNVRLLSTSGTSNNSDYGTERGADVVFVHVITLDDRSWFAPQMDIYESSAQHWDRFDDALPRFPKMPPMGD